jgi:hypothetical protein
LSPIQRTGKTRAELFGMWSLLSLCDAC